MKKTVYNNLNKKILRKFFIIPLVLGLWASAFLLPSIISTVFLYASSHVIDVTPASHDFGNIDVSDSSTPFDFTLENSGPVSISGSVSNPGLPFTCAGCGGYNLNPGTTKTISVTFSPTASGPDSGTMTFSVNSGSDDSCSATETAGPPVDCAGFSTPTTPDYGHHRNDQHCGGPQTIIVDSWYRDWIYTITQNAANGGIACPRADGEEWTVQYYADCSTGSASFVAGTQITLANGEPKDVKDIVVGDVVQGSVGSNTVIELKPRIHKDLVYSINESEPFVTPGHPFMTTKGWKAFDVVLAKQLNPDLDIETLKEGDILITDNGEVELQTIGSKYMEVQVYNFEVSGTRDYYADGFLVHNK